MARLLAITRPMPRWLLPVILLLGLPVSHLLDRWAWRSLFYSYGPYPDLYYLFRVFGYLPAWLLAAALVAALERPVLRSFKAVWRSKMVMLVGAPALAGLGAIVLKIVVRRLRPASNSDDPLRFRPFTDDFFNGSGLAFPSEHAAVGFAAAIVLSWYYPKARVIWWLWAIGCGLTRVVSRGHFVSDVYGGLIVAAGATWLLAGASRRDRMAAAASTSTARSRA